jgi:DNA polymerase III delta prime subunit
MSTIEEIIQQEANPFDPVTFKAGNFWLDDSQKFVSTVKLIHQEAIDAVAQVLHQVSKDHRTRSVLLYGDPGSGKTYVLWRLKQTLNDGAFFVYIGGHNPAKEHIWQFILRQTIDSLMHKPDGKEDPQLLLWLNTLTVFKDQNLMKRLLGEKKLFVRNLQSSFPTGIYQAREFFSVLYELTQPESYLLACDWLRGDNLSEEDLKILGVRSSINSELAAQGILSNIGRISTSTYPIVLCFDQVESAERLQDGSPDAQPIFTVNTAFHNENWKNFLILLTYTRHSLEVNRKRIHQSDLDRIEGKVVLKPINLEQAEALWASRLYPLHQQAQPKPSSSIYPLSRVILEKKYPGGRLSIRSALKLGEELFKEFKLSQGNASEDSSIPSKSQENASGVEPEQHIPPPLQPEEETATDDFKLLWQKEFSQTQERVSRMRQFSSDELRSMLQRVLQALQVKDVEAKLLESKTYAGCSLSYQRSNRDQVGVVWYEDPHMQSFCNVMKACQKVIEQKQCSALFLIRAEGVGNPKNSGYKAYHEAFSKQPHVHIKPDLESLHYLATYDRLLNSVRAEEVILGGKTLTQTDLEILVRETQIFQECELLQALGIVAKVDIPGDKQDKEREKVIAAAKDFILSYVRREHLVSRKTIFDNAKPQFPKLSEDQLQDLIQKLCKEGYFQVLDESAPFDRQIICVIPGQQAA